MAFRNVLASLAVRDLAQATKWYARLLGRAPDATPMAEVAEWKFERGGWLQVYQLPERAGSCSCTLVVDDIGQHIARLDELGLDTSQQARGGKVSKVMVTDPDGNHLALAEAHDASMAR
jgi:predicted enzyme related to lactoylglutathione lyase